MMSNREVSEAIERTFEKFAYIDIDSCEIVCAFSPAWQRSVQVEAYGGNLFLACTPTLAQLLFNQYTGTSNSAAESAQYDALKELVNVLAGHFYFLGPEIAPRRISIPRKVELPMAERLWTTPAPFYRAALLSDAAVCGGISIELSGATR